MLQLQRYIENCLQGNVTCETFPSSTSDLTIVESLPSNAIQVTSSNDITNNFQKEFIFISYDAISPYQHFVKIKYDKGNDYWYDLYIAYDRFAEDYQYDWDTLKIYKSPIEFNKYYKFDFKSTILNSYYPSITSIEFDTTNNNTKFKLYYLPDEPTSYTVTIDANGGTGTSTLADKTEITTDDLVTIKTQITRTGYILTGLSETSAGSAVTLPYALTADKTMYCVWATPDNLQTKTTKLINYAKTQLSSKGVTSTATTLRGALDDIANIEDGMPIETATMPTPSADNLGKIYKYTGTTNDNYTNGELYIVQEVS